jgi:hypothetical protein
MRIAPAGEMKTMFKQTIQRIFATALQLLNRRRALATFAGIYVALLATIYGFVGISEATWWQVLLTLCFVILAPVEFFVLQASIVDYARNGKLNWYRALSGLWKLAAVTLPMIALGLVLFVIMNRWQSHFPAPVLPVSSWLADSTWPVPSSRTAPPQPVHWPTLIFATLRWLLFGLILPLVTIQLWIEAANDWHALVRGGARSIAKRMRQALTRAFAPASVLTYTMGLILFAMLPYALLFAHLPLKGTRSDFALFTARLVLAFLFMLFGWVLTITTLARDVVGRIDDEGMDETTFVNLEPQTQS